MSKIKSKSSRTIRSSGRSAKGSPHIRRLRTAQEGADAISSGVAGAHHEPAGDPIPEDEGVPQNRRFLRNPATDPRKCGTPLTSNGWIEATK
jgi:hypothetical protein